MIRCTRAIGHARLLATPGSHQIPKTSRPYPLGLDQPASKPGMRCAPNSILILSLESRCCSGVSPQTLLQKTNHLLMAWIHFGVLAREPDCQRLPQFYHATCCPILIFCFERTEGFVWRLAPGPRQAPSTCSKAAFFCPVNDRVQPMREMTTKREWSAPAGEGGRKKRNYCPQRVYGEPDKVHALWTPSQLDNSCATRAERS